MGLILHGLTLLLACHAVIAARPSLVKLKPQQAIQGYSFSPPWFCHSSDCPPFTNEKSVGDIELRSYEAGWWVSTNVTQVNYDTAVRTGFLLLYEYISGANEHGTKMDMTSPVRTRLVMGSGPFVEDSFTVSFYLPYAFQTAASPPPKPNRDCLFLDLAQAQSYYVYSYGGFTSESKILEKMTDMVGQLDQEDALYGTTHFFAAGYDPPFRLINRHNELWVPALGDEPEPDADADAEGSR